MGSNRRRPGRPVHRNSDRSPCRAEVVEELVGFLEAAGSPTLATPLAATLPDPWDQRSRFTTRVPGSAASRGVR